MKLILASASPRRKELLGHLKLPFEIVTSSVNEESPSSDPIQYCLDIALLKGQAVLDGIEGDALVISADTIVCLNQKIYGKPKDREEAKRILMELSGKTHSVYTAVVIHLSYQGKIKQHSFVEESKVSFNPIETELLERYLDTGDSLDKAGAYGIQGPSLTFISRVEGDYANVVGFPLSRFIIECNELFSKHMGCSSWLSLF